MDIYVGPRRPEHVSFIVIFSTLGTRGGKTIIIAIVDEFLDMKIAISDTLKKFMSKMWELKDQ